MAYTAYTQDGTYWTLRSGVSGFSSCVLNPGRMTKSSAMAGTGGAVLLRPPSAR